MAAAAVRRLGRYLHVFESEQRQFALNPLRSATGSAALTEASAWRRPSAMIACALIGTAALAVAWPTPLTAGGVAPLWDAAQTVKQPVKPARLAKSAKPATRAKPARTVEAAKPAVKPAARTLSPTAIRIAIVDTGVAPLSALGPELVAGADFVDSSGTTADQNGHGTAMASIADALCPTCAIVPVRVLGATGIGTTDLAAQGVRWATANGARVINLSLTANGADDGLTSAIEDAVASGVVVVVAAGNSGSTDPAAEGYPGAGAVDAITVASVDPSHALYSWSNHGSWVHLAAPGAVGALTTSGSPMSAVGTSASAAYVSGVAGLLLSCNPSLTPAQVHSILLASATPLAVISGGLVDPAAALAAATPAGGCAG